METIRQLLSRIRWDDAFGQGEFDIGIYDRMNNDLDFHPLEELFIEPGNHASFRICIEGTDCMIPFHRIREVRKNGACIWKRPVD